MPPPLPLSPSEGCVNYPFAMAQQLRTSAFTYISWVSTSNYMLMIP